jgi:cytochrome c
MPVGQFELSGEFSMRLVGFLCVVLWFMPCLAGASAIHDAAKKGDAAGVAAAIDAGADINESDGVATALYYAARRGHFDAARLLVERGADVNALSQLGSPLTAAAAKGRVELMKLLLQHGANPNSKLGGEAALHTVAKRGCLPCVEALVEAGADVNVLTANRQPALHFAKTFGFREVSAYLLAHGAALPNPPAISAKLGAADVEHGQFVFRRNCSGCHSTEDKPSNMEGPSLWNVVGRQRASLPNRNYSEALREWNGSWSFEDLNVFISAPMAAAPGVKMTFPGLEAESDRIDIIAFLRTLSGNPVPLP